MNICKSKNKNNLLEVFDEEGNIKKDDEAVEVWFNHFSNLLSGSSMREAHLPLNRALKGMEVWTLVIICALSYQWKRLRGLCTK